MTLSLMETGIHFYLLAPPADQLLLGRCYVCWWGLCFGPFVWVEADFLHLRKNPATLSNCVYTVTAIQKSRWS